MRTEKLLMLKTEASVVLAEMLEETIPIIKYFLYN